MLRIGYAMCIVVGAAFVSLSLHEARILGPGADASMPPPRRATGRLPAYVLPGAAPRTDLAREVTTTLVERTRPALRGASMSTTTLRGRFTVVPIVDTALDARAAGAGRGRARPRPRPPDRRRQPAAPSTRPRRAAPVDGPAARRACGQALEQAGLSAAPGLVIGRWVRIARAGPARGRHARCSGWSRRRCRLGLVIRSTHPRIAAWLPAPAEGAPRRRAILHGFAALALPCLSRLRCAMRRRIRASSSSASRSRGALADAHLTRFRARTRSA